MFLKCQDLACTQGHATTEDTLIMITQRQVVWHSGMAAMATARTRPKMQVAPVAEEQNEAVGTATGMAEERGESADTLPPSSLTLEVSEEGGNHAR